MQSLSAIGFLELISNSSSLLDPILSHFLLYFLSVKSNFKAINDHIYAILQLNILHYLAIKQILNYVI